MTASYSDSRRSDAIQNEKLILRTASRLFDQYGVKHVTMKQIAGSAEIGPGTLYRHFKNKPDICQRLMDDQVDDMFLNITSYVKEHAKESAPKRIKYVLHVFLSLKEKNLSLLQEIENAGRKSQALLETPFYDELKNIIMLLFQEIEGIKDVSFHTDMLLNAFSSDIYYFERYHQGLSPDDFLEKVCDIYVYR